MFKKLFVLFSIILCGIFLTGCIDLKVADEYTVNEDSSIDHTFQLLVGNNMYIFANQINEGLAKRLAEEGFSNIVDAYDSDYFGKKGTKHIQLQNGMGSAIKNNFVTVEDNSIDYFIFKHINITAYIDFQKILNNSKDADMITFTEYKLTINLPAPFKETNASSVYNDGKSATWRFSPSSGSGTVHFECYAPNKDNILFLVKCIAGFICFLILLKILTFTASKNNKITVLTCPNCGVKNKSSDTFCAECGHQLTQEETSQETVETPDKCPQCGTKLGKNDVFCGECGYKINNDNNSETPQNVKKCPQCNAEIADDDIFCGECGYKLTNNTAEDNDEVQ